MPKISHHYLANTMKATFVLFLVALLFYTCQATYSCHCSSKTSVSMSSNALTKKAYNHVHFKVVNCPGDKWRERNPLFNNISTYDTDGKPCRDAFIKACKSFGAKTGWCANL
ncbi:uncharacterized protein BYT42DRAFT_579700 [Radiomyces spectabilis]|uniref:uncharacterized protein n=1 Tax=Radiomyces spectabilis TaxID=64574 RepID=UPI00221F0591|nr:uncharacterized protein BYT42DRAFT_579700 [Radiomyces spectabilis]KAI8373235.1 hypothetical protein BYT42DRAFT_579700 [Radiomyces spectabilis]